ncbi:nicotinate phosphoribosyltransferase [Desulfurella sp.]|uniref:nicotinate phosphoribosyltransferase n=1 Tax=Desulfurella sp. TaxID=1962857 RepID=UPI003D0FF8B8
MFISTKEDILNAKVTDVYFDRTAYTLKVKGLDKRVKAEVSVKKLPKNYRWGIFVGLEEVLELLNGRDVNVRAIKEGSIFRENEPVLEIEGLYSEFAKYETAILGFLCQESGVATKAARLRKLVKDKQLLSFGARRMHPAIAVAIERAAYIGGCDGVSTVLAANTLNIQPSGTIPHSLVLLSGDTVSAAQYFDETMDINVPRIILIDTFGDEKFETLRVFEALGKKLSGIRLDTPNSRRGNLKAIIEEIRWELSLRGTDNVKIFASGGLDEETIEPLVDVVDGFGVGTSISSASTIDFSMDIVEIEGKPIAKKGKNSGSKSLFRCKKCFSDKVVPYTIKTQECSCGGSMQDILEYVVQGGKTIIDLPNIKSIREHTLTSLRFVDL